MWETSFLVNASLNSKSAGVSISSEVGGRPIKVGSCNTSGAVRPLPLGGSRGMLPQKFLESRSPEMPFPAFWHQIQY